jgi:hypothetical protein
VEAGDSGFVRTSLTALLILDYKDETLQLLAHEIGT